VLAVEAVGFGLAGVVVLALEAAGFAEPEVVVLVVETAGFAKPGPVVVAGAGTNVVVVVGLPTAGAVVVDAEAGKLVSGVGSGGKGLDNTLAINSFRPASD